MTARQRRRAVRRARKIEKREPILCALTCPTCSHAWERELLRRRQVIACPGCGARLGLSEQPVSAAVPSSRVRTVVP